jgi:hypothetical protein
VNPKTGAVVATFDDDTNAADYESPINRTAFRLQQT